MASSIFHQDKLNSADLKLLFPPDNVYQHQLNLATHLIDGVLVEELEWEGESAIGETAFWLKVLSLPREESLKLEKLKFKREVYDSWVLSKGTRAGSGNTAKSNSTVAGSKSISVPVTPLHRIMSRKKAVQSSSDATPVAYKRPLSLFERAEAEADKKVKKIKGDESDVWKLLENLENLTEDDAEVHRAASAICDMSTSSITTSPLKKKRKIDDRSASVAVSTSKTGRQKLDGESLKFMKCSHCSFTAVTRLEVDTHKFGVHKDVYPIPCPHPGCMYRVKQKYMMKNHLEWRHSTNKKFKCGSCDFMSKTEGCIQKHIRRIHNKEKWKCSICDFQCSAGSSYSHKMHMAQAHGDMSQVHKCQFCDFFIANKHQLVVHITQEHGSDGNIYRCGTGQCEYSSAAEQIVIQHRQTCNGAKKYADSSKTGKNKAAMIYRFWCSVCGMKHRSKRAVDAHIVNAHQGKATPIPTNSDRPGYMEFHCSQCNQTSMRKAVIDSHINDVHEGTGECVGTYIEDESYVPTLIKCAQCDFTAKNWCGMRSHVRANHTNNWYKCDMCNFVTNTKSGIGNHKTYRHSTTRRIPNAKSKSPKTSETPQTSQPGVPMTAEPTTTTSTETFTPTTSAAVTVATTPVNTIISTVTADAPVAIAVNDNQIIQEVVMDFPATDEVVFSADGQLL